MFKHYWKSEKWFLAKGFLVVLVGSVFLQILILPMWKNTQSIIKQMDSLQNEIGDEQGLQQKVEKYHKDIAVFLTTDSLLKKRKISEEKIPPLDSLRRVAESFGLSVQTLKSASLEEGMLHSKVFDFVLRGSYQSLRLFLDEIFKSGFAYLSNMNLQAKGRMVSVSSFQLKYYMRERL